VQVADIADIADMLFINFIFFIFIYDTLFFFYFYNIVYVFDVSMSAMSAFTVVIFSAKVHQNFHPTKQFPEKPSFLHHYQL